MIVKICGNLNLEDIDMVAKAKPDFMGFVVNCPSSPRSNTTDEIIKKVKGLTIPFVFLFVNEKIDVITSLIKLCKPFAIQLHGNESVSDIRNIKMNCQNTQIWKAIHLPTIKNTLEINNEYTELINAYIEVGCDLFVLDSTVKNAFGGTGVACDWELAAQIVKNTSKPILLAGGLTPENVKEAIQQVKPYGVDVSSGVEKIKGKKDKLLVQEFINNAKEE